MFSDRARRRLEHIVGDAEMLRGFLAGMDVDSLLRDERTMFAVERLLQRVTEAVIQIGPEEMALVDVGIPVAKVRAFGNLLRHEYADVDAAVVYTVATQDVPALAAAAVRALTAK